MCAITRADYSQGRKAEEQKAGILQITDLSWDGHLQGGSPGSERLALRRKRRDVRIRTGRRLLGTDRCFTGVSRFEGPEERPAERRPSNMDIAEGHSESVSLVLHRGKASFIRKGSSTEEDRLPCLTVEHGKRFRAAGETQHDETERVREETYRPHTAIVADMERKLDYRAMADEPDFSKAGFRIKRPRRTWSLPGMRMNSTPKCRPWHHRTRARPTDSGGV